MQVIKQKCNLSFKKLIIFGALLLNILLCGSSFASCNESVCCESLDAIEKSESINEVKKAESKVKKGKKISNEAELLDDMKDVESFFKREECVEQGAKNLNIQFRLAQIQNDIRRKVKKGKLEGPIFSKAKRCLNSIKSYFDEVSKYNEERESNLVWNTVYKVAFLTSTSSLALQYIKEAYTESDKKKTDKNSDETNFSKDVSS